MGISVGWFAPASKPFRRVHIDEERSELPRIMPVRGGEAQVNNCELDCMW